MLSVEAAYSTISLYPNKPDSLLPILRSYLPHSLPVYSLIACNFPSADPSSAILEENKISDDIVSKAWTTFPASSAYPELFVVIIHVPGPQNEQVRMFCSLEAGRPNEDITHGAGTALVKQCLADFSLLSRQMNRIGALSTYWSGVVRNMLDAPPSKAIYNIWLAPTSNHRTPSKQDDLDNLMVDKGKRQDCEQIQANREIYFPIEYYISRIPFTFVVRETSSSRRAVAWILENAAGDIGCLYVIPQYRRRGLAKRVIEDCVKSQRARGVQSHVWVADGNKASEALWIDLGWEKGWSSEWVPISRPPSSERGID